MSPLSAGAATVWWMWVKGAPDSTPSAATSLLERILTPSRWQLLLRPTDPTRTSHVPPAQLHGLACHLLEGAEVDHHAQTKPFSISPLIDASQAPGYATLALGWLSLARRWNTFAPSLCRTLSSRACSMRYASPLTNFATPRRPGSSFPYRLHRPCHLHPPSHRVRRPRLHLSPSCPPTPRPPAPGPDRDRHPNHPRPRLANNDTAQHAEHSRYPHPTPSDKPDPWMHARRNSHAVDRSPGSQSVQCGVRATALGSFLEEWREWYVWHACHPAALSGREVTGRGKGRGRGRRRLFSRQRSVSCCSPGRRRPHKCRARRRSPRRNGCRCRRCRPHRLRRSRRCGTW